MLEYFDSGLSGNARQNGAAQYGGHNLVAQHEEDIHRADFLDVLALYAVQPEHLAVTLLRRDVLRLERSRVVAAGLGIARAADDRADILGLDVNLNRRQTARIIRTGGTHDNDELVLGGGMCAQRVLGADDEGTDVQRRAVGMGNPVAVDVHEHFQRLLGKLFVDERNAQTVVGAVETGEVLIGAEQTDFAVHAAIRLHTLKDFLAVMQTHTRRGQIERTVGDNARIVPMTVRIVHDKHMIGENLTEAELALVCGLLLRLGGKLNFDFFHDSLHSS